MFGKIDEKMAEDIPKIVKVGKRLLDIDWSDDHSFNSHQLLDSILRVLEKAKKSNREEVSNEAVNVVGFLYGELIVREVGWGWAYHYPTPELMELCVVDP